MTRNTVPKVTQAAQQIKPSTSSSDQIGTRAFSTMGSVAVRVEDLEHRMSTVQPKIDTNSAKIDSLKAMFNP
ncbi:hypothetical protein L1887_16998 [Cichorium endivia]|nr:hypothetical protein L1887_16998 [Cichorium endivia]